MSYLAIYRRFRPTTFSQVIGQEHVIKTLTNQINGQRVGHAYLFCGARGTGKTSVAKIFARAINCLTPENGSPCFKCQACQSLANPTNLDILEIDAASNNGVDDIRELRESVQYPPVAGQYKVYIIDEVHMLSPGTQYLFWQRPSRKNYLRQSCHAVCALTSTLSQMKLFKN